VDSETNSVDMSKLASQSPSKRVRKKGPKSAKLRVFVLVYKRFREDSFNLGFTPTVIFSLTFDLTFVVTCSSLSQFASPLCAHH